MNQASAFIGILPSHVEYRTWIIFPLKYRRYRRQPDTNFANYVRGYLVHSRCWTLAEKVFGSKLQDGLKPFLESLAEYFGRIDLADLSTPLQADPIAIPAIRNLFKPKPGKQRCRHAHVRIPLSYDLQFMILELLECDDVCNLVIAFGWELPDIYWRRRMRKDLIFEVENIKESVCSCIDWQAVYLQLPRVLKSSEAFSSRRAIVDHLHAIKDIFLWRTGERRPKPLAENTETAKSKGPHSDTLSRVRQRAKRMLVLVVMLSLALIMLERYGVLTRWP